MADTVGFTFGENWRRYADTLDPGKIDEAVASRGFECLRSVTESRIGDFGTGCDEYLFERNPVPAEPPADA